MSEEKGGRHVADTADEKILLTALFSLVALALFSQQAITDTEVAIASDTLLKSPKDPKAWQTFQAVIRTDNGSSDIRSRVMFAFAVSHLLNMNTNLFTSAMQTLQTRFPQESAVLTERLTTSDWLVQCPACGGTGTKITAFPTGQKSLPARCLECAGSGKIFQLSRRVNEALGTVLGEIKALATENILFADASKKAMAEHDPRRRLAALLELVGRYPHRHDLDEAKQMSAKAEAEVAKEEAVSRQKEAAQALREQEEKDYRAICSSLESLPDSGIPVMLREIDGFIGKYPKSVNRLELEICKSKLRQREKIHAYLWLGFYICTGLAALSMVISLIRELFARKAKKAGPLSVPGLTQKNEEADPLAGTFTDSDQP